MAFAQESPPFSTSDVTVSVPGTADPWLAGMPAKSAASCDLQTRTLCDVAPAQSPVPLGSFTPGALVTITATGGVNNGSGPLLGPDGDPSQMWNHNVGPENGMSNLTAPASSLVGVFLGPDPPNLSPAPAPAADPTQPGLKQVFLIGSKRTIIVPAGTTRFFLGTMDSSGWANNNGTFTVRVSGNCAVGAGPCVANPSPILTAVKNAASYASDTVSGGEVVAIFGQGIGPKTLTLAGIDSTTGHLANSVAGARVLFDGQPSPVWYVSDRQSAAIVPYGVIGKSSTQVIVEYSGLFSSPVTINVAKAAPGVFSSDSSGKGQGAIFNQDNSPNSVANPAAIGSVIVLYGTGEGQTSPPGEDGKLATSVYPKPAQPISVSIGGYSAQVLYSGAVPGLVAGLMQINAVVPAGVSAGDQPVILTIGGISSQASLTVNIR
jgi:uncharacterized protein (TIGR03437 family)